jgi:hypothetical protein
VQGALVVEVVDGPGLWRRNLQKVSPPRPLFQRAHNPEPLSTRRPHGKAVARRFDWLGPA